MALVRRRHRSPGRGDSQLDQGDDIGHQPIGTVSMPLHMFHTLNHDATVVLSDGKFTFEYEWDDAHIHVKIQVKVNAYLANDNCAHVKVLAGDSVVTSYGFEPEDSNTSIGLIDGEIKAVFNVSGTYVLSIETLVPVTCDTDQDMRLDLSVPMAVPSLIDLKLPYDAANVNIWGESYGDFVDLQDEDGWHTSHVAATDQFSVSWSKPEPPQEEEKPEPNWSAAAFILIIFFFVVLFLVLLFFVVFGF